MRSKNFVTLFSCLRLKRVIQALHLEYSSTQSIVVLIADTVPHGFLLIQARAMSSGGSLIWAPLAASLWMFAQWLGQSPHRMGEETERQGSRARLPDTDTAQNSKYSSYPSPFWCMVFPSMETLEKCLKTIPALWTFLIRTPCSKWCL